MSHTKNTDLSGGLISVAGQLLTADGAPGTPRWVCEERELNKWSTMEPVYLVSWRTGFCTVQLCNSVIIHCLHCNSTVTSVRQIALNVDPSKCQYLLVSYVLNNILRFYSKVDNHTCLPITLHIYLYIMWSRLIIQYWHKGMSCEIVSNDLMLPLQWTKLCCLVLIPLLRISAS